MVTRRLRKDEPQMLEMPARKMAVVTGRGAPDRVFPAIASALYKSAYTLKFDRKKKGLSDFKVSGLRARYPDAHLRSKEEWTIILGLPVPEDVATLPQQVADTGVIIETWEYGTVAQILHLGPYDTETPTIERLQSFITESGYEIAGAHEEEYLTRPDAKVIKTLVRYPVRKKS
ncbi:GyrI-like domain-containing protein [Chloroflexota bacterium]